MKRIDDKCEVVREAEIRGVETREAREARQLGQRAEGITSRTHPCVYNPTDPSVFFPDSGPHPVTSLI